MLHIRIQSIFSKPIYQAVLVMVGFSVSLSSEANEKALQSFLDKEEEVYRWSVEKQTELETEGVTLYDLLLVSQEWKNGPWTHQLRVVVPDKRADTDVGLLFITGGSNTNGHPNWKGMDQDELTLLAKVAKGSGTALAILNQVPNQPLYGDRKEDDLISYTFVQYLESQDTSWPLLFPMTKSAVKAMDALQAFSKEQLDWNWERFVVSGGSKRGWTTWLTGAHDPRVAGIAPMVIDVLNFEKQIDYQIVHWGKYSEQIKDYETKEFQGKNLLELIRQDQGEKLAALVDPYTYLKKLTMPKLIFIGTNDPYWPVDAVKHYFSHLPGQSFIHYVPNAGHGLGDGKQAIRALTAFIGYFVNNQPHPAMSWTVNERPDALEIQVQTGQALVDGHLWLTTSMDRDVRNNEFIQFNIDTQEKQARAVVPFPKKGYVAAYVDAEFQSPIEGTYTKSTRMYLLSPEGLVK